MTESEKAAVDNALKVGAWLRINKAEFDRQDIEGIKERLTIRSKVSEHSPGKVETHKIYREKGNELWIPRQTGFMPPSFLSSATDCSTKGSSCNLGEPIELRDYQSPIVDEVMHQLKRNPYGGILCAAAGSGKTVMGLETARRVGRTTLILVHKEFFVDQWTERINQFLPQARIGYVQQDRCEFGYDYDIVIGMIQSLAARRYDDALYKWPGLIISDEVHRLGAETWSEVITQFDAQTRLGLTATPRRKDGMEPLFFWHIGPIIANAKREDTKTLDPNVKVVDWHEQHDMRKYRMRNGKFNLSKWITGISESHDRNEMICHYLIKALEKGRKVMALSDRRAHLTTIQNMINMKTGGKYIVDQYVGQRKKEDLQKAAKANLILGTYRMADEGLDIADLDSLVMMTPKSDIEQAVGRIQRIFEGKPTPVVIDVVDRGVPASEGMSNVRRRGYTKLKATFI
jgi:superfamily II DNA or RNA helicase